MEENFRSLQMVIGKDRFNNERVDFLVKRKLRGRERGISAHQPIFFRSGYESFTEPRYTPL